VRGAPIEVKPSLRAGDPTCSALPMPPIEPLAAPRQVFGAA